MACGLWIQVVEESMARSREIYFGGDVFWISRTCWYIVYKMWKKWIPKWRIIDIWPTNGGVLVIYWDEGSEKYRKMNE